MPATLFKRLILRAVLRNVYPMVIRLVAVPDSLDLNDFDDIFHAVLGWDSGIGFLFRIHGQEFNSFRRKTRSKKLRDFRLHPRKTFSTPSARSTCGNGNSEWSICKMVRGRRSAGVPGWSGRGATAILRRPHRIPADAEAAEDGRAYVQAGADGGCHWRVGSRAPGSPSKTWELLRSVLADGSESIDRRLEEYGPLEPERFNLEEANQRLAKLLEDRRFA